MDAPSKGAPTSRIFFRPCSSLQIWNARWDAGGFNAVAAGYEVIFEEMDLSLDNGKFIAEVSESVIGTLVPFNLGSGIPVIEVSNSAMEGVESRGRTIEQGVEPDGGWLSDVG
jgi:hypothetical protein